MDSPTLESTADGKLGIGLLGPVVVEVDGADMAVSAARQRAVLALLALHPGQPLRGYCFVGGR